MQVLPHHGSSFGEIEAAMAGAPLHEAISSSPGEAVPALGFALGLAAMWTSSARLFVIRGETWSAEEGKIAARGLAAFGIDLDHVVGVETRCAKDALWAAEQALALPGAMVVAALNDRDIDLTASRRLLLQAERSQSRAFLVRASASGVSTSTSAAHTRWRIAAAPSRSEGRLLGPPVFSATLLRRRKGPPGAEFELEWNAHARCFRDIAMAGDLVSNAADGQAAPRQRAG